MSNSANPILDARIDPDQATTSLSHPPESYTYYHAAPLFAASDLQTNVHLSKRIRELSNGKYQPILPQDIEQRDTSPQSIRDADIKALWTCDLALFTYDGSELDSGTVVEYTLAKFADLPTVILRTDFRGGGDQTEQKGDPWNLMSSFWPRTVGVVINAMVEYKTGLKEALDSSSSAAVVANQYAGERLIDVTAGRVIDGFDQVLTRPARLPKELRQNVYQWLALAPGFKSGDSDNETNIKEMLQLLQQKEQKSLF